MASLWTFTLFLGSAIQVVTGVVDVALDKPARMSSYYGGFPAGGAVDGNITTVWPDVIHTDLGQNFSWWMVDLQGDVQEATVEIYFRTVYTGRRNGTTLYTSVLPFSSYPGGQLCYMFSGSDIPDVVNTTCPGTWRYLMVYTDTWEDGGAVLNFGEVIILGCLNDTYGPQCSRNCDHRHCNISSSACDPVSGRCHGGCLPGWKETDCMEVCLSGSYGLICSSMCGNCAEGDTCNHVNGSCPGGCQNGWQFDLCQEKCAFGFYGPGCTSRCGKCAANVSCDHMTGSCDDGCEDGYQLATCTQKCPNGSYGPGCRSLCRRCVGNVSCDHVTGNCDGGYEEESELAPCPQNESDQSTFMPYVIGGVIGAAVMLVIVLLICLVRFVRSRWNGVKASKSADSLTKPSHKSSPGVVSHTVAETPNPALVSTNDYAGLGHSDDQHYDVIQNHDYENNQ